MVFRTISSLSGVRGYLCIVRKRLGTKMNVGKCIQINNGDTIFFLNKFQLVQ